MASWRNIPLGYLEWLPMVEPRGAYVGLCRAMPPHFGAEPCPREKGHPGECFWAVTFEHGSYWKAIVYRGRGREKVARGDFSEKPTGRDLLGYLQLLTRKRLEEAARRQGALDHPVSIPETTPEVAARSGHVDPGANYAPKYDTRSITPPRDSAAARAARAMVKEAQNGYV